MGAANTVIDNLDDYQRILEEHPLVIVLFTSPYCQACMGAGPHFNRIADKYAGRVKSLLLDTTKTPKIVGVDGTPTLVVYKNALEVENLKGIGEPQYQEEFLEGVFSDYAPATPASPAAPQPPRRSGASPHAPGYHPPRAGGRAGSSPTPPGFDSPRSRQP